MLKQLKPLIITGFSGIGKSSMLAKILEIYPSRFKKSVSHNTRAQRPDEQEGVHYYFISKNQFDEMVNAGQFLE